MILRVFTILALVILTGCANDSKKSNQRVLPTSSGNLNHLSVVMPNDDWDGEIGSTVRKVFAAPLHGLPQKEPTFNINQMPPSVFSGFTRNNRIILRIQKGDSSSIEIKRNVYARPQKYVVVKGRTKQDIVNTIRSKSRELIASIKAEEVKERQRQIKKSLNTDNGIKETLGIDLYLPSVYRVAKATDNFFWLRKDLTTGTNNIMIYEVPLSSLKHDSTLVQQIIRVRDSIGKVHIPGPTEGTYLKTEEAYSPFFAMSEFKGRTTYEVRSTWDVKDAFMAGPFVAYFIKDVPNNRYLVAEGFTFAPSVSKRNYVFDLEAIIKSIRFIE